MYWFTAKSMVVSGHRWRSVGLLLRSPLPRHRSITTSPLISSTRNPKQICRFKERKTLSSRHVVEGENGDV
nr:GIY-YIG nuclease superfamily [Tanacetum cinerariifolium]